MIRGDTAQASAARFAAVRRRKTSAAAAAAKVAIRSRTLAATRLRRAAIAYSMTLERYEIPGYRPTREDVRNGLELNAACHQMRSSCAMAAISEAP